MNVLVRHKAFLGLLALGAAFFEGLLYAKKHGSKKDLSKTQEYVEWKSKLHKKWKQEGVTTDFAKRNDLIGMVEPLVHMKKLSILLKHNVLFAYIFFISKSFSQKVDHCVNKCKPISSIKDIDHADVNAFIKSMMDEERSHIWGVCLALKKRAISSGAQSKKRFNTKAIVSYNIVREIWRQPKIQHEKQLDMEWLDSIKLASEAEYYNRTEATMSEHTLLKKVQEIAGIREKILLARSPHTASNDFPSIISLEEEPDLDDLLFGIYHEISHIKNKDPNTRWLVDMDVKKPNVFLKKRAVKKDLERILKYTELGKTAFDQHSREGKVVNYLLSRYKKLWNTPSDKKEMRKHLVQRTIEARADLFAMDMLYKHHDIVGLLNEIELFDWGNHEQDYSVNSNKEQNDTFNVVSEGTDDPHPSWFERVLYIAGFLASKEINVSKALEEWRDNGVCRDIDAYVASL